MLHPSRRDILTASMLAAPALLTMPARATVRATGSDPFTLGVASGEPAPDGVVLWTRLAPEPLAPHGGLPPHPIAVRWQVAEDERFERIARSGSALADPAAAHSVHVEVAGLRPGRGYFYRFIAGGAVSPVGRTRTAPAHGAPVDALRFCFGSCQKYEAGYYAAWRHVVAADPELIVFLGDYIYENAPTDDGVRRHPTPEPFDLEGYRLRYASYKRDSLLQAAHAAAPWISTWDDHEVANDYAGALDEKNGDPALFLQRRAAAYRAYWEHMPLRAAAHPAGPDARLYHALDWGTLAQFQIIDDRQYRGARACQPPELLAAHKQYLVNVRDCPDRHDAARTMLGGVQERWLLDQLGTTRARWNLLAQQTLMAPFAQIDPAHPERGVDLHAADRWEGYPAARERIFRRWAEAKTPNPIVLSGDIHAFAAADIRHPDHPEQPPIAAEFVGGSITSLYHHAEFKQEARLNPGFRYAENEVRGFGQVELKADRATVEFRGLANALDPQSSVSTIARFEVEGGRGGIA
ncbi:alkaline phosphatase D family protein [Sphingomonas sp. PAMC 26605]|uniref:alkaline phosphatase D family protein n=1 Tax=Sphingomonas sp. PAMC 26605 TaxID=1112214 RepID=UPI00026CCA83|nr:alkaline phosphatase D family protein [Sphingomonas sp. PAMC 26605]